MKTITLATFNTPAQAEPLRHRLGESHIKASIHGEGGILTQLWFVKRSKAGIKVDVPRKDYDRSLNILEKMKVEDAAHCRAVRCPKCRSSRVEYPQYTGKFFLPNLIGLLSAIGLLEKRYYCQECHNTWLPRNHKPHKLRAHMAPNYFLEEVPEPGGKG